MRKLLCSIFSNTFCMPRTGPKKKKKKRQEKNKPKITVNGIASSHNHSNG